LVRDRSNEKSSRLSSGIGGSLTLIPSWHAVLSDPGESDIDIFQKLRCRHWPSPNDHRLGTPDTPAIRSTRAVDFAASLVRFRGVLGSAEERDAAEAQKRGNGPGNEVGPPRISEVGR
jgi:hypothetical protein